MRKLIVSLIMMMTGMGSAWAQGVPFFRNFTATE